MTAPSTRPGRLVRRSRPQGEGSGSDRREVHLHAPFKAGFLLAAGALLAYWLGGLILSVGSILVLVVVALFLAAGLNPLVLALTHRGLRRSYAVLVVTVGVLAAFALFLVALVPVIADQVEAIADNAPGWFQALQRNQTVQSLEQRFDLLERAEKFVEQGNFGQQVFGGVVGAGLAVLSTLANTLIVIVLTLYFLASLPAVAGAAYRLAPASRRPRVQSIGDRIIHNVGAYVSGAFLVGLTAGISSLVFLMVVGLGEYAVALALVVALLDLIPMIGATLGAVIVTAIGFANGTATGLACLVFYVIYQQVENYVIYPRVMSRSVDIPGSLIVIAALIGAGLLGVVGALLAIPIAAAVLLVVREVVVPRQDAH